MIAVKVWTLVFLISIYNGGGPAVIDDLPTKAECQRVGGVIDGSDLGYPITNWRCIERWKLVPKTEARS